MSRPHPVRRPTLAAAPAATAAGLFFVLVGCLNTPAVTSEREPNKTAPLSATPPEEPTFDTEEQGTEEADRPFLNDFSWRDFIALNWPADDRRGVPDAMKKFGDPAERVVWESWKSLDELFPEHPDKTRPTEWDSYKAALSLRWLDRDKKARYRAGPDSLPQADAGKVKFLQQLARLEDVNQVIGGGIGADIPIAPLIAQNKTYVRFETRVNREAYQFVADNGYYIRENQYADAGLTMPKKLEFPPRAINVKAAWMELPDETSRKRFYHTKAKVVVDWVGEKPVIEDRVVGLVGLHIVHKTPGRRDWVWSTFEHVDNLLCEHAPGEKRPASFSTKDPAAATGKNEPVPDVLTPPAAFPPLADRKPVEVVRLTDIHPATKRVNERYQQHPQVMGTVWENYKLVGTQWPKKGLRTRPSDGGGEQNRLPKDLANVTMETYTSAISCLRCHAGASPGEFVFYPQVRAVSVPAAKKNP